MTLRILLADDHPLFCDGVRYVLSQYGEPVEMSFAHDEGSTLRLAADCDDLDLVLLDVTLPGASGISCLSRLRCDFPLLPVVMLSANEDSDLVNRSLQAGAQGYIPKSSTTEIMLHAIRLVLAGGLYVPKQALGILSSTPPTEPRVSASLMDLTPRQREVLQLLATGMSNKQIARQLNMSDSTVRVHVTAILRTLNVSNRTQAGMAAMRCGLLAEETL